MTGLRAGVCGLQRSIRLRDLDPCTARRIGADFRSGPARIKVIDGCRFAPRRRTPMLPLPPLAVALALLAPSSSTTTATATATTLPLRPDHAAVRAALLAPPGADDDAVDGAINAAFASDPDVGAGFVVRRLERRDAQAACARVVALVDGGGPTRTLALPRHLRCLVDAGGTAPPALLGEVLAGPLGRDPRSIDATVRAVEAQRTLAPADVATALRPLLTIATPPHELARRAAVAAGLRVLALRGPADVAAAARVRLLDELPEQPATDVVDDRRDDRARRIARAATWERLQRNTDVIASVGDLADDDCEAALLVAKAQRKLRRYSDARQALGRATRASCGEVQKKARYLELRVGSIQKGASLEPLAAAFARTYGKDPLVDDVLVWLAETRDARGDRVGRDEALARVVNDFPDGDMADDARFRLALSAALSGDAARARRLLDDTIAALQARPRPKQVDLDRARYWRARLALFPDPRTLDVVADPVARSAGRAALAGLANARGASFYGQLARRLLATSGDDVVVDGAGQPRTALADDATVAVPQNLANDPRFRLARTALDLGFDDEVTQLLVDVVADPTFAADRAAVVAVAAAFVVAGRPDRAHQTFRGAGFALLDGEPDATQLAAWSLSWPRAHLEALRTGADAARVPLPLLMGLAREESAFDAAVVSWAGAIGLCQLMPGTAADEARALKLPPPSTTTLVDPMLNARLGGAHLGRRLRGMSHPLLAIAAYNAGPGAVARWMPAAGTTTPLDLFVEQIPVEETRNYVKKVTGSWVTYATLDGGSALDEGPLAFAVRVGR
jgi:soluble lytic murein transglycosylase